MRRRGRDRWTERRSGRRSGRRRSGCARDPCGTANMSREWGGASAGQLRGASTRPADRWIGDWHNVRKLSRSGARINCAGERAGAVDEGSRGAFDAVLAMNFSYWCASRCARRCCGTSAWCTKAGGGRFSGPLRRAGRVAWRSEPQPVGRKNSQPGVHGHRDQAGVQPITHETLCHIHPDERRAARRAFTYDWRVWSIPEYPRHSERRRVPAVAGCTGRGRPGAAATGVHGERVREACRSMRGVHLGRSDAATSSPACPKAIDIPGRLPVVAAARAAFAPGGSVLA